MTPREYRILHHRCMWCKYKKFHWAGAGRAAWYSCIVKGKYIPEFDWLRKWRGMFCKVYVPKEIDFEI